MEKGLGNVVIFALEQLIKNAPGVFAQIQALFQKTDVTVADLQALRDKISGETYESIVTNTQLPK